MHSTEDEVKAWLRGRGIPVPRGGAAASPDAALSIAQGWDGAAVVKALVPAGRRGKAGAIRFCADAAAIATAARDMLGTVVNGHAVGAVYVEQRLHLAQEFYLAFHLESFPPQLLLSREGGVDIEDVHARAPEAVLRIPIDPLQGVRAWEAIAHWERAGVDGRMLPALGRITAQLYDAFVAADATMLEINPLGLDSEGQCCVVGAMMTTESEGDPVGGNRAATALERRIIEANAAIPGGMMRYTELDGDIGMFVGGGGAGLMQHDLMLAAGGRPANHMDASTTNPDKVRVLIETVLDNSRVKGLLVGWHYQQMAQIDRRVIPIVQVLKDRKIDARTFPVVIRMFGPGEDAARQAAAGIDGVHYLPNGAPLEEAIRLIVELTRRARQTAAQTGAST